MRHYTADGRASLAWPPVSDFRVAARWIPLRLHFFAPPTAFAMG
jgi:hypothetical protein